MVSIEYLQTRVRETYFIKSLSEIYGWLSRDEQSALYALALYTDDPILEIGPWVGLSTACIAYGIRDSEKKRIFVTAEINPDFANFSPVGDGGQIGFFLSGDEETRGTCSVQEYKRLVKPILTKPDRAIGELRKNLTRLGLIDIVTIFEGTFSRAPDLGYKFIFCDATHNPYEISLTAKDLQPYLSPGTILACHDINRVNEKALRRYIAFDASFKIDSLFIGQVADQQYSQEKPSQGSKIHLPSRISRDSSVSIILPTYNRAHLLPRAILSVLDQTYQNFELVIIDDASTDETSQVVKDFDDPRIQYIRHERNQGASAARNTGIKASRGEYIAFQDSDDEWLPEKLERQMNAITHAPPEIGVVYSSFWQIRDNNKSVYPPRIRKLASLLPSKVRRLEGDIHDALLRGNLVTTQAALVRKTCFEKAGMFDERLPRFQDWELWLRVSKHYHFKFIDDPLLFVYPIPDSISTDSDKLIEAFKLILDIHYDKNKNRDGLLAQYLHTVGDLLYQHGNLKEGRTNLFQAARLSPFNTFYWLKALASLFGQKKKVPDGTLTYGIP